MQDSTVNDATRLCVAAPEFADVTWCGRLADGHTAPTLEDVKRRHLELVMKGVSITRFPRFLCEECRDAYIEATTTSHRDHASMP